MTTDRCDERDSTNKKVLNFIRKHRRDAQEIAEELNIPVEWILGLSGQECGYGTSEFARNAHNFFGLHPNAPGNVGNYPSNRNPKVSRFTSFRASAQSFATRFGELVRGKKTSKEFVDALVPEFNTTIPPLGNPKFREETQGGIKAITDRIGCLDPKPPAHKCEAICKDFEQYGYCDRLTTSTRCWQHS